jgi:hypothetical protein
VLGWLNNGSRAIMVAIAATKTNNELAHCQNPRQQVETVLLK